MKSRDRESNRGRASEKNSIDEDRITESRPLRVEKKVGRIVVVVVSRTGASKSGI